jgi:hypothetical protein
MAALAAVLVTTGSVAPSKGTLGAQLDVDPPPGPG